MERRWYSIAPIPISEVFQLKQGSVAEIRGWVYRKREFSDKMFLVVRDSTGVIQTVIARDRDIFQRGREAGIEASIIAKGRVKKDPRAPGGTELHLAELEIVGNSSKFPITRDVSREFLLDIRHLSIRSRRMAAVLKIRDTIFGAVHEFFRSRGYYEVHCPMFITAAVEGGATLFEIQYIDGRKVYLTQSSQFYLEALIFSLEKVYTVAPSFRAEKSRTRRHLTEFWHAEAEAAWLRFEDLLRLEEELIEHVVRRVLEENQPELKFIGRSIDVLEEIRAPFYRISYDDAIRQLQEMGFNIHWGEDLGADEERALTLEYEKPLFICGYPEEVKAFYHKSDPKRSGVTLSADLLANEGYGEIIGGGERIEGEEELIEKIKRFGLKPEDYEWYIDLRRYGSVPHSGFGLGMDRLTMWIAGLEHIVDAIPFPRTIRRVYP